MRRIRASTSAYLKPFQPAFYSSRHLTKDINASAHVPCQTSLGAEWLRLAAQKALLRHYKESCVLNHALHTLAVQKIRNRGLLLAYFLLLKQRPGKEREGKKKVITAPAPAPHMIQPLQRV
jgi:hypothetical protein